MLRKLREEGLQFRQAYGAVGDSGGPRADILEPKELASERYAATGLSRSLQVFRCTSCSCVSSRFRRTTCNCCPCAPAARQARIQRAAPPAEEAVQPKFSYDGDDGELLCTSCYWCGPTARPRVPTDDQACIATALLPCRHRKASRAVESLSRPHVASVGLAGMDFADGPGMPPDSPQQQPNSWQQQSGNAPEAGADTVGAACPHQHLLSHTCTDRQRLSKSLHQLQSCTQVQTLTTDPSQKTTSRRHSPRPLRQQRPKGPTSVGEMTALLQPHMAKAALKCKPSVPAPAESAQHRTVKPRCGRGFQKMEQRCGPPDVPCRMPYRLRADLACICSNQLAAKADTNMTQGQVERQLKTIQVLLRTVAAKSMSVAEHRGHLSTCSAADLVDQMPEGFDEFIALCRALGFQFPEQYVYKVCSRCREPLQE